MGAPRELRDKILRYVLIMQKEISIRFWTRIAGQSLNRVSADCFQTQEVRDVGCLIDPRSIKDEWRNKTGFLLTCKQAHEEGRVILYGENQWSKINIQTFEPYNSSRGPKSPLRANNAALIKYISIQLERDGFADSRFNEFAHFISHVLPKLQSLRLMMHRGLYVHGAAAAVEAAQLHWEQAYRKLLSTVAAIAQHHPTLKKAIWRPARAQYRLIELQAVGLSSSERQYTSDLFMDFNPANVAVETQSSTNEVSDATRARDPIQFLPELEQIKVTSIDIEPDPGLSEDSRYSVVRAWKTTTKGLLAGRGNNIV